MNLDFSFMDNMTDTKSMRVPKRALEKPTKKEKDKVKQFPSNTRQNILEGQIEAISEDPSIIEVFKIQNQRIEAEKRYIKQAKTGIKNASRGKANILKAIQNGETTSQILVIALETLADISQDETFRNQSRKYLEEIQGEGLGDKVLIDKEIEEVTSRYNKLKESHSKAIEQSQKKRIEKAIEAHQEKLIRLNKLSMEASNAS